MHWSWHQGLIASASDRRRGARTGTLYGADRIQYNSKARARLRHRGRLSAVGPQAVACLRKTRQKWIIPGAATGFVRCTSHRLRGTLPLVSPSHCLRSDQHV